MRKRQLCTGESNRKENLLYPCFFFHTQRRRDRVAKVHVSFLVQSHCCALDNKPGALMHGPHLRTVDSSHARQGEYWQLLYVLPSAGGTAVSQCSATGKSLLNVRVWSFFFVIVDSLCILCHDSFSGDKISQSCWSPLLGPGQRHTLQTKVCVWSVSVFLNPNYIHATEVPPLLGTSSSVCVGRSSC